MNLQPVPPIRTEKVFAFVNRGEDYRTHTQEYIDHHTYPAPHVDLRAERRRLGLTYGDAARKLGLSLTDVAGLERGSLQPADPADWDELLDRLERPSDG